MVSNNVISFKWKKISQTISGGLNNYLQQKRFTDVTLVSDDQIPFQAHKIVLSSFSTVIRDLILDAPHPHPTIYLKGVKHQELDSILKLIYHGQVQMHQSRIKQFVHDAKELELNRLFENTGMYAGLDAVLNVITSNEIAGRKKIETWKM